MQVTYTDIQDLYISLAPMGPSCMGIELRSKRTLLRKFFRMRALGIWRGSKLNLKERAYLTILETH